MVTMRTDFLSMDVEGLESLEAKIDRARRLLSDLSPMWELFLSDFYKDEKRIFQRTGPGPYADLSAAYKVRKQRIHGFIYPINFATGEVADSLTRRGAPGSVAEIRPTYMVIGTTVRHAKHLHGRRPLWDDSPQSPMFKRWERIADVFLTKAAQGAFDGT